MRDTDHDGTPNRRDRDKDGDGLRNAKDPHPLNPDLPQKPKPKPQPQPRPQPQPAPLPEPLPPVPSPAGGRSWVARMGLRTHSGLPWLSGITPLPGVGSFERMGDVTDVRGGRRPDILNLFQFGAHINRGLITGEWLQVAKNAKSWGPADLGPKLGKAGMWAILSIPTITEGCHYADAAAGKYISGWKAMFDLVKAWGLPTPYIIRPGREANDDGQPFAYHSDKSPGFRDYKRAHELFFKTANDVLGEGKVLMSWCLMKRAGTDWREAFPGKDVCAIMGVDFYGNQPFITSQADWDRKYVPLWEPYEEFARKNGLLMAVDEWGIKVKPPGGMENDNEVYAGNMWRLFQRLAADGLLTHECMYCPDGHNIVPPGVEAPRTAAAYRKLWAPS